MPETATTEKLKQGKKKSTDRYIVAIGASAGGLEAIHEFFDNMAGSASFAFVIIQHLSPDHKSLLVELVSKHTHMKVFEAANNMPVQQDCVYIIPNNKTMTISSSRLQLADKSVGKAPNMAIDTFLKSLAIDRKDKAIAIILSGTGSDGTKGIQAIKECGGMVVVQDPSTAKFDGMPNSAIASGNADFVAAPKDMCSELFKFIREEPVNILDNGKVDERLLDEIFRLVHKQSGNDFNLYKTPTIIRRISRRVTEKGFTDLESYVQYLQTDSEEVKILGQDFLIGVTRFFRDGAAFDHLESEILPALISNKQDGDSLKVWVCACSTGQEAYSIAIAVNQCVQRSGKNIDIKIFATDIDEKSIEIAAKNQYPLNIDKEVPEALLKKYFVQDGKFYSVLPAVRKQVVFAKHDVIKSPPFIKNDMITCRNMLIYVNSILQQKILSTFHFSLLQGGYLFLGPSETASSLKDGLTEVHAKYKIYQKTGIINYSTYNTYLTSGRVDSTPVKKKPFANDAPLSSIEKSFNKFITDDLGYVGLYIDKSYIIQEAVGNYRQFLTLPEKKIELNLLKMVSKEVAVVLNSAIRKAWKENKKTQLNRVRLKRNQEEVFLNISIQPPGKEAGEEYTLIVLGESLLETPPDKDAFIFADLDHIQNHDYVTELESELNETRVNLQMAVEEMETTNEELQSSNEELLSSNEELQSSNEELQSLNEELHTLNTEHQLKIKELQELNDDLDNYFRSTEIGQIFLDSKMRIRKFNPAAIVMVNLIPADIGRSIEHISNNIRSDSFTDDLRAVMLGARPVEKEVSLKNGTRSLMRIMPYTRKDKKVDGVVITFVDISKVTELNNMINGVFNASLNSILAFSAVRNDDHRITDFRCVSFNNASLKLLNKTAEELSGAHMVRQLQQLTKGNIFEKYVAVVEKGAVIQTEIQLAEGQWHYLVVVKMADGFAATLTDITDRKEAEQKLRKNYNELIIARENLRNLNADLEVKIRERTQELTESEDRFNQVSQATNDTIWDWNLVNNTIWRSDNFTKMFGYEYNDETANITFWFNKIHPEDRKRVTESVYSAINGKESNWSAEYRLMKADGDYAVILDRGSILHDEFKTPYRMVGSIVDATRLNQAEKKLHSSEKKFRKVFESNVIGMIFTNLATRQVEDANAAYLNMLGLTRTDLQEQPLMFDRLTPPEFAEVTNMAINQVRQYGVCPAFEKQYFKKDGSRIWVLMGSALLNDDNKDNVVTYVVDITTQKESERRRNELQALVKTRQDEFFRIFQSAPAIISIRRGTGLVFEFVNQTFIDFYGAGNYLGKTMESVYPEYEGSEIYQVEQKVLASGETYIGKAYLMPKFDPQMRTSKDHWFDFIFTPVYTDDGAINGIAYFGFDVSDLMVAQIATRELMQKKDEFMSIASHELKTPITSIKGSLQIALRIVQKNQLTGPLQDFMEKANRQAGKLTNLVNDLLDVTKIQAGKLEFNYSEFDMAELVQECVEDVQEGSGFEIVIKHSEQLTIKADRQRLEQVICNFLSNALKYSPDSKLVEVYSQVEENFIKVTVKDFGIGIPDDKTAMVFDRFFRVQESSTVFSGLGLGLYISAEIVKRHGGQIGVYSKVGEGSEFWFKVPLIESQGS